MGKHPEVGDLAAAKEAWGTAAAIDFNIATLALTPSPTLNRLQASVLNTGAFK